MIATLVTYSQAFVVSFWDLVAAMAPYLLLGLALAGLLHKLLRPAWIRRQLRANHTAATVRATVFGIPLPLCSCGVIPVAASLRRSGAGIGPTAAFAASTPQTGVDSVLATGALLGWPLAMVRVVVAFFSGIVTGIIAGRVSPEPLEGASAPVSGAEDEPPPTWRDGLEHGFVTLPRDLARALLLGLVIAAAISALLPADALSGWAQHAVLGYGAALLLSVPVYVCSTGSIPLAFALVHAGFSPGAALLFLVAGPATNAASITTLGRVLGRRALVVYLAVIMVSALGAGVLFDMVGGDLTARGPHSHVMEPSWWEHLSGVVLALVFGVALLPTSWLQPLRRSDAATDTPPAMILAVDEMSCAHCAQKVRQTLTGVTGVRTVDVALEQGRVAIWGDQLDAETLAKAVSQAGYPARPA